MSHVLPADACCGPVCLCLQLLAAACDRAIRVWDTKSWSLLMLLQGHSDTVHVLSGHPFDPRVVLSAGYDGRIILWDTATGAEIQRWAVLCLSSAEHSPVTT